MVSWTKGDIGKFSGGKYAIRHGNYIIAKFITYVNGKKIERYALSDISGQHHKHLKWFDNANEAKLYYDEFINK